MRRILLSFFLLTIMGFKVKPTPNHHIHSTNTNYNTCQIDNFTFQDGEELVYKIYYNWNFVWIPAGEVVFSVHELPTEYHFKVVGKTYRSYEWFFKVRDYYDSWVDKKTLLPNTSIRDITEGKYTLYDKNEYNRDDNTIHNIRGRTLETVKEDNHFQVAPCLHDMVSILYFTRNFDFRNYRAGDSFPIQLFADKETFDLRVGFEGRENSKHIRNQGYFNTLHFTPDVVKGNVFPDEATLHLWVTNDDNRLPLLIESPVSVGSIKAVLKSYKNLRHDVTAKIGE